LTADGGRLKLTFSIKTINCRLKSYNRNQIHQETQNQLQVKVIQPSYSPLFSYKLLNEVKTTSSGAGTRFLQIAVLPLKMIKNNLLCSANNFETATIEKDFHWGLSKELQQEIMNDLRS
jgi:hypothetical protein